MLRRQFVFIFIAVANGCAPSIPANDPVLTTTSTATATPIITTTTALTTTVLSNSSTTTTTSSPITTTTTSTTGSTTTVATTTTVPTTTTVLTTTTVPTTTIPPNCCGYPIRASTTNSAMPPSVRWNGCNESVSLTCQDSGIEGVIQIVGIIANYNTVDYSSSSSVVNNIVVSGFPQVTTTFTCNTEAQLWSVQGQTGQFSNFACVWKYLNGPYRL